MTNNDEIRKGDGTLFSRQIVDVHRFIRLRDPICRAC